MNILSMSIHQALPIIMPNPEILEKSLRFNKKISKRLRNLEYVNRLLKRVPLYIWVGESLPPQKDLEKAYLQGFEIFYSKAVNVELDKFVTENYH